MFSRIRAASPMLGGVGVLVALLAGGCGNGHRDVRLPATSAPGTPSAPTSAEGVIRQTYSQYWAVLPQAEQAATPDLRRQLLTKYATNALVDQVMGNVDRLHAKNLTSFGYIVVHIEKMRVEGDQANVWDCQDSTHAALKNSKTGQVTSKGAPNDHVRATLVRGPDGRWRINKFSPLGRC